MTHRKNAVQAGGAWLAIASFLMIAALGFHGPIAPDLSVQMTRISAAAVRWYVVLGMWFGVGIGNLLWVGSSIAMSFWTLWFGIRLVRAPVAEN